MASSVYPPQPSKEELRMMFYESAIRFGIFCVALRAAPYVVAMAVKAVEK